MATEPAALSEPATQVKAQLQSMGDYAFEHFVADLWAERGYSTEVSQEAIDAGIDVVATKQAPYPQKELIQAKRYKAGNTVGGPDVQQYASLKHQGENVDSVVVVTTSSFTRHARERADDLNVKLVDGDQLVQMVQELDATHLLAQHGVAVESESTETQRQHQPEIAGDVPEASFPWMVFLACCGWTLFGVLLLFGSGTGVGLLQAIVGVTSWGLLPVGLFFDASRVTDPEDKAGVWVFTAAAAIPGLGYLVGLYYLFLRMDVETA